MAGTEDERALTDLYREMWRCMVAKDIAGLAACCADDYTLTHMTGVRQDRQAFLDAVADGTLNYFATHHDRIDVRVAPDGRTARLTGCTSVEAAVYGGGRHTWQLRGDFCARREADGRWRFTEETTGTY